METGSPEGSSIPVGGIIGKVATHAIILKILVIPELESNHLIQLGMLVPA